jgi:hypothetical protein
MNLKGYRNILIIVSLIFIIISSAPALSLLIPLPIGGEPFSEFWILGPGLMAENYPFNVTANEDYLVYVGIRNHLASSAYYVVYVKFRNQSESLPNATIGTPSSLPPLYQQSVFLQDGESWESPLTFSFSEVSFAGNRSFVKDIVINEYAFEVGKEAYWDSDGTGFYYQLFMELWLYNVKNNELEFHSRFLTLRLNVTL